MAKYVKPKATRKPFEPEVAQATVRHAAAGTWPNKAVAHGYTKSDGLRPTQLFVVVTCGIHTEKIYFETLNNKLTKSVRLEVVTDHALQRIRYLIDRAQEVKAALASSADPEQSDRYFLVSDVDDFYGQLAECRQECRDKNLELIISNPCFEIWLYYGRRKGKPQIEAVKKLRVISLSRNLKNYNSSEFSGIDATQAFRDLKTAIANAEASYSEDTSGIPDLFSTQMWRLGQELLPFVERRFLR